MGISLGILLALACVICWSVAGLVTKLALDGASKWKVLFFSQLFSGVVILIVGWLLGSFGKLGSDALFWIIGFGIFNLAIMYSFYEAMRVKGVALTSSIVNSWPFVTTILGAIFYHELVKNSQVIAIALILAGILAITFKNSKLVFDNSFLFAVLAMLLWGFFLFALKIPVSIFGIVLVTSGINLVTSVTALPFAVLNKVNLFETKLKVLVAILLVGFFNALGFLAYVFGIVNAPISIVAPIVSAVPALSAVLAVVLLKEKLTRQQCIGIVVTVIGICLITL